MILTIYPWKFTNRRLQLKDLSCFGLRFYKSKFGELRKSEFVRNRNFEVYSEVKDVDLCRIWKRKQI